jgi:hypothetical protein
MFGPIGPACKTPIEIYGSGDDEKRVCGLQYFQQHNTLKLIRGSNHSSECVIYSLGSNNQWGFEEAIIAKTTCRIETFDCTGKNKGWKVPKSIKHRVRFHELCIGGMVNNSQFISWTKLPSITGIIGPPTFLKMDVEGYEFPILREIIISGTHLPLQIALEIHTIRTENGERDKFVASTAELISFIQFLRDIGGYYLIDRHNNGDSHTEYLFARLNCESNFDANTGEKYTSLLKYADPDLKEVIERTKSTIYYNRK